MHILGGEKKGKSVVYPEREIRPTQAKVKEALFNILEVKNKTLLDLCAGSGAVGFEALSRGARFVTFVDIERKCIDALIKNAKTIFPIKKSIDTEIINKENINYKVKRISAFDYTKKQREAFDIIYFDPPYEKPELYLLVIENIFENKMLEEDGVLVVEFDEKVYKSFNFKKYKNIKIKEYGKTVLTFLYQDTESPKPI